MSLASLIKKALKSKSKAQCELYRGKYIYENILSDCLGQLDGNRVFLYNFYLNF